jgi:divalent metal cation (Fe/Co/Zn/Cd) transporter
VSAPLPTLDATARAHERSMAFAVLLDCSIGVLALLVALVSGSLTLAAETIRGWLLNTVEIYAFIVMRRIHRGRFAAFEFGAGKLEQMCNVAIAVSMLGGAAWIIWRAAGLLLVPVAEPPLGMALAAAVGAINSFINFIAWDEVRRAAGRGRSTIMKAELQARVAKLISSGIVQLSMTVAALAADPVIGAWADGLGALFVSGYIVVSAAGMLRAGLPDLLDRSVDEATQIAVLRALAHHFEDYDQLGRVRSRRSGHAVIVEIGLAFDRALQVGEVDRRLAAIRASIEAEVEGADVALLVSAAG